MTVECPIYNEIEWWFILPCSKNKTKRDFNTDNLYLCQNAIEMWRLSCQSGYGFE